MLFWNSRKELDSSGLCTRSDTHVCMISVNFNELIAPPPWVVLGTTMVIGILTSRQGKSGRKKVDNDGLRWEKVDLFLEYSKFLVVNI
ncbi:hypothetical protein CEXT_612721 [Caerostris extrusa]|uniref:Transmembrane protein n=1 Tax=Caerostris extrusa TaxID=172846 RepID=A0AAV4XBG9_CAEEX|nr:hypothetical protein CEXT_612721 [Caerostris extrusa]